MTPKNLMKRGIILSEKTNKKVKKKLTAYEQELAKATKKVKEFMLPVEASIVLLIYQNPDILYNHEFKLNDFKSNVWKVFYAIANGVIITEKKSTLDVITVNLYLDKHPKLKERFEEYGGYETCTAGSEYTKMENLEGLVSELKKWNVVLELLRLGFPVAGRLKEFVDMSSEEIYGEYEALLNHVFINTDGDINVYNIADGIDELIDDLNNGLAVGMPYYHIPIINKETGGMLCGNVDAVGALSNVGKSTFILDSIVPSIIENDERIIILLNEGGIRKFQREFLVWTANNIFKEDLQKYIVRDGKYNKDTLELLRKSATWIKKQKDDKRINILPMKQWSTQNAIKIMKKFHSLGVDRYVIDTFKSDAKSRNDNTWLDMQQNIVDIYDIAKPEALNIHVMITFQLEKGKTAQQRFYTQSNTGMAKNLIDSLSTVIMLRKFFSDEYPNEKNELHVYKMCGKNGKTKTPVMLDPNKHYQIAFIVKNREGAANEYQTVLHHDLSRNILEEVGICVVPVDF